MSWIPFYRSGKAVDSKPPPPPEPKFTQGHRLTLNFIVELLQTLRDRQHDYHIDDVLELHIGHLTDIYVHVVTHLKQSSERTIDHQQPKP